MTFPFGCAILEPMEANLQEKLCAATTKKGAPCRNRPLAGSEFCARHQPETPGEAKASDASTTLEPVAESPEVEEITPSPHLEDENYFKSLIKPGACILAALIVTVSCCCGLFFGTGFTAWLYEAVEGPYEITQIAVTELPVTQVVVTFVPNLPAPTYTFYPTYTPLPTLVPSLTLEPSPTPTLEPTLTPTSNQPTTTTTQTPGTTATPQFTELYRFSGVGQETTDLFSLQAGLVRIRWNYVGEGNFAFSLKRLDTDFAQLIENAVGNTDGQSILSVEASDQYIFDVVFAGGNWEIIVEYSP